MRVALKVTIGFAAVLAVCVVFLLLLPRFASLEPVKARLVADISERTGLKVEAGKMDMSFVPRPSITLIGGTISGKVEGSFESLSVYPQVLPLFVGRIRLARMDVKGPDIRLQMPEQLKAAPALLHFSPKTLEDAVTPIVSRALALAAGLVVSVGKGRLTLLDGNEPAFRFGDIDGSLSLGKERAGVTVTCTSNIWRDASLKGWLEPVGFKGQASLEVARLIAGPVARRLFPQVRPQIEDAQGDISLKVRVQGVRALSAEVDGRLDHATLRKTNGDFTLRQVRLKGAFRREGEKTTISVAGLDSVYPALRMSGQMALDPASSSATADVSAREADVAGVRSAILFFAGQVPDVREVMDVVRAGKVSGATFSARGGSLREMLEKANIIAGGSVTGGRIVLADIGFRIEGIEGHVRVAKGFLEGTDLSGRMGGGRATKGALRLDLEKGTPLRLDMEVSADVAELPLYLKRLVPDPAFAREMGMVRTVRGKAEGRLVYDSLQRPAQTIVDVSSFSLHAAYDRFPYPLDVEGGSFVYDGAKGQITARNLAGKAGTSSFSDLSAQLALGPEPYLTIDSCAAGVALREIYPWLRSMDQAGHYLEKIGPAQGSVKIGTLGMKGRVLHPRQWQFRLTGEIEDVTVRPAGLPGPVEAMAGRFDASQDRLSFSDLHARCLDASLVLSGAAAHYLEAMDRLDLSFGGELGDGSARWVSDFIRLPRELRVRAPLSVSKARLLWEEGHETSFSGDLNIQNGPRVSLGLVSSPGGLIVKPLVVRDAESNASMLFDRRETAIDVAFKGSLTAGTVDSLLAEKGLVTGRIRGDIQAHVVPGRPVGSTAKGSLEGAGITVPGLSQTPVRIAAFDIKAEGESASVRSDFTAFGQRMSGSGKVGMARDAFALDLDLSTGGLDLEQIAAQTRNVRTGSALRHLPLEGTVRVRAEYVSYGRYLWRPVQADITFNRGPIHLLVKEANVCGIDTPGRVDYDGEEWAVDFVLASKAQEVMPAFVCMLGTKDLSGVFAVNGEATAKGRTEGELLKSLRGETTFFAKGGRIYRFGTLAKIFEIAGLTAIYAIPDLMKNGFAYNSVEAKLEVAGGRITIKEGEVNAPSADLIWKGDIDPIGKKIDALVLVVPFTTLSRIIDLIPLVRYVLAGRLLAIPVRVSGDLGKPDVTPLPPSAVGAELLGMGERILKLPLRIIESVLPRALPSANR